MTARARAAGQCTNTARRCFRQVTVFGCGCKRCPRCGADTPATRPHAWDDCVHPLHNGSAGPAYVPARVEWPVAAS